MVVVIVYIVVLVVAAFVRFWTEGGYWQAIHTGRTFMLQGTTLTVGIAITHFDLTARLNTLKPYISGRVPDNVKEALVPPLLRIVPEPVWLYGIGVVFLLGYVLTGFFERDFLTLVGNPPHPKKYIALNQEPTRTYETFIGITLWLGAVCLLAAWYFIVATEKRGLLWYLVYLVVPVHLALCLLLFLGPKVAYWITGTEGRRQIWDVNRIPREHD